MNKKECIKDTKSHIHKVDLILSNWSVELLDRGANHDRSKLMEPELSTFVEFTPRLKASTYGSEEYKQFLEGMQPALKHHYSENRHHPEHFRRGMLGMTLIDLVELIADWKSATLRHDDGDLLKSIEVNQKRFGYPDYLKEILVNTARSLYKHQLTYWKIGTEEKHYICADTPEDLFAKAKELEAFTSSDYNDLRWLYGCGIRNSNRSCMTHRSRTLDMIWQTQDYGL